MYKCVLLLHFGTYKYLKAILFASIPQSYLWLDSIKFQIFGVRIGTDFAVTGLGTAVVAIPTSAFPKEIYQIISNLSRACPTDVKERFKTLFNYGFNLLPSLFRLYNKSTGWKCQEWERLLATPPGALSKLECSPAQSQILTLCRALPCLPCFSSTEVKRC